MTESTPANEVPSGPAITQEGAYEVLRGRLAALGTRLQAVADDLNARRLAEFGDSQLVLLGRFRVHTEHNTLGRDVVQVGDLLLFGFNVHTGLKAQTRVEDVFSLHRLVRTENGHDAESVGPGDSFLADPAFVRDFEELYAYYKHARLLQLAVRNEKLLAAFQIGERSSDRRVFRWSVARTGELSYMDARGDRDLALPAPFDFEWVRAGRELEVSGRFPHLNILDTLFVDTGGGALTLKVENNTETGEGLYSEPVEDRTQSLDDARFEYARVGSLILLKVLPYRERQWRGLVYNTLTRKVVRNDAILQACVQLPEDHGILFPGGFYLQNGEHRAFDAAMQGMEFAGTVRSPNGEDVLYVFYERESGLSALFVYNLIRRQLQTPLFAHGHARLPDGRMVLFRAETSEPTRVHPMQVWQTPFTTDGYAAARPASSTFLGKLGNAELVRAVSNLYDLAREALRPDPSAQQYGRLTGQTRRLFELHHWLNDAEAHGLGPLLHEITATGEAVLDEFEKVQSIRLHSEGALEQARSEHRRLLGSVQPEAWNQIQDFVDALNALSAQRGHLLTIRGFRYIDTDAIDAMTAEVQEAQTRTGTATGTFLEGEQALHPFRERLQDLEAQAERATTARELSAGLQAMQALAGDLDLLSELLTRLPVDDLAGRTRVVEAISSLYARLNQGRARSEQRRKTLGSGELVAQFAAQFNLFGQSVTGALGLATTPERTEEQLARLMVGLEELEGQFGEHEEFLTDILARREETLELFGAHRQALLEERQRKAQAVQDAAARILSGLSRRTERLRTPDELNAFFAGDPLVLKLRELAGRLRDLNDAVRADDIEARLSAARDQAVRALRDRSDLFEDGGHVIRLGPRHRFSVNTQPLDLTLLPQEGGLSVHLTGTNYLQPLNSPALDELRAFWHVTVESESPEVYRGEYLAGQMLHAAEEGRDGLDLLALTSLLDDPDALVRRVRAFAAPRYRGGYEKGIHDHDAAQILRQLVPLSRAAGPLIYSPVARALAVLYWAEQPGRRADWQSRAGSAHAIGRLFGTGEALQGVVQALALDITGFLQGVCIHHTPEQAAQGAAYLVDELRADEVRFGFTQHAAELLETLEQRLAEASMTGHFRQSLDSLSGSLSARWTLALHWLGALTASPEFADRARSVPEAAALLLFGDQVPAEVRDVPLTVQVSGLLGEHSRIQNGRLTLAVDETLARLRAHREQFVPAFHRYQALRQEVMARERERLRLSEYRARPLTSFVRNRLINDVYLPLIGDNLAKQMGTVGEGKRSDLMGLLMLISPPGYGKTTLMEYVASRLGLVFVRINGPSLGHGVRSLDPAQAPDTTSRQELEKLNLALEMGDNVMLYVDDLQHTHAEFLQKFISLTDGTRRIEGVWQGCPRTHDLRGRRFAVVMAGNPYTESGEVFKVPDMLANRADIYNLGDVLGGVEDAFLLSYIENSLTSNPVLAPLATRDLTDLYLLVDRAQGKDVSTSDLTHAYSPAEVGEIVATLRKLIQVRDVLSRVNAQYIASAAQADGYRTEPPFKLQGSYRNMNKLAEKVSPVMNGAELDQLITDHYLGEAQLLTTGAEENLLKLAELRGTLTAEQAARWEQIKSDFLRNKAMGAADANVGGRVVAQLADIARELQLLGSATPKSAVPPRPEDLATALQAALGPLLTEMSAGLQALGAESRRPGAPAVQDAVLETLERTLVPLLNTLAASSQRQEQLSEAFLHLADALSGGDLRGTRFPLGRHPKPEDASP